MSKPPRDRKPGKTGEKSSGENLRFRSDEWRSPRQSRADRDEADSSSDGRRRKRSSGARSDRPDGGPGRGGSGRGGSGRGGSGGGGSGRGGPGRGGPGRGGPGRGGPGRGGPGRGGPRHRPDRQSQQRRTLSNQGGAVEVAGPEEYTKVLAAAMKATEQSPDRLTHLFHSYPARMHPEIPRVLLDAWGEADSRVLDPFCGGGTVLIEARARGIFSAGVDLNPLAIRIAEVKSDIRNESARKRFVETVDGIAVRSEERVRERKPVRASLNQDHARRFDIHILKELAGLLEEIREVDNRRDRRALEVLFSAIVHKFSKQEADTVSREAPRRLRKGLVTEFFVRKASELVERWAALETLSPEKSPRPRIYCADARDLTEVFEDQPNFSLIISSPPYGGTYDYVWHHELRMAWLGLDASGLERGEIGARRRLQGERAAGRWDGEMRKALESMTGVLSRRGRILLVVGDAQFGPKRVEADAQLRALAPEMGLRVEATAAQKRTDYTGRGWRREHLVMLVADD